MVPLCVFLWVAWGRLARAGKSGGLALNFFSHVSLPTPTPSLLAQAPIFRMDMFDGLIGPSLYNAYTGWGLDMLWPFKLRYPKNQIAVIDEVCM